MRKSLLLSLICGTWAWAEPPPDPIRPDHAPTPYSAAEIAACCVHGRTIDFLIKTPQGSMRTRMRFLLPNARGVEVESQNFRDGKPLGPVQGAPSPWKALQAHASFPSNITTVSDGAVKTPVGEFSCKVYTVIAPSGKRVLYFAKHLAGPPVKMLAYDNAGKEVMSMVLIKHVPFDFPTYLGDQKWPGMAVAGKDIEYDASASLVVRRGKDARMVVVGTLRVRDGVPLRHVALRVKSGALRGAVLRLLGHEDKKADQKAKPQMIVARAFALPKGWTHPAGPLDVEVVDFRP